MNPPAPSAEGRISVETVAETEPGGRTLGLAGTRSERFRTVTFPTAGPLIYELQLRGIRELQLRGLAERILIVAPANPGFQWERELLKKFDETLMVLEGGASCGHNSA